MADEYHEQSSNDVPYAAKRHQVPVSNVVAGVLGAIVLLIIGFFAGVHYGKGHAGANTSTTAGRFVGGPGGFGGRRNGSIGSVTAISGSSITVNDQRSGSSKTYTINSSTQITDNGSTVSASSITVGDTVLVTASSSTSTTATRILVNPSFGGGFGGASSPASQSSVSAVTN